MDKKVAVVTGSARGIGLETARQFCAAGYNTVICDIVPEAEFDKNILAELKNAIYIKCDISSALDRAELFKRVYEKFKRVDVLVNNAGIAPIKRMDILETTSENFARVIDINLTGTFFMCQEGAKYLMKTASKFGVKPYLINISSMSAYTSSTSRGEYCISKAGVSMVTKLFADRLSEFDIPVFEIRPGIILTDMTAVVKEKYEKLISEGITPTKRFGLPSDIAKAVLSLTSGAFDFSTGQAIEVDGGFHIRRL